MKPHGSSPDTSIGLDPDPSLTPAVDPVVEDRVNTPHDHDILEEIARLKERLKPKREKIAPRGPVTPSQLEETSSRRRHK